MIDSVAFWIDVVSGVLGIASTILAGFAWLEAVRISSQQQVEAQRRAEPIKLILRCQETGTRHVLGYRPRRDQATRAELLGILGMYMGQTRFETSHMVPLLESGEFDRMLSGEQRELTLALPQESFERIVAFDKEVNAPADNCAPSAANRQFGRATGDND